MVSVFESIGYYIPYEERTEEKDWYAKDMKLTHDQMIAALSFLKKNMDLYEADAIYDMIGGALYGNDAIIVNADW